MKLNASFQNYQKPSVWICKGTLYTTSLNISETCKVPHFEVIKNIENLINFNNISAFFKKNDLDELGYNVLKKGVYRLLPFITIEYQEIIALYKKAFNNFILPYGVQKEEANQI